MTMRRLMRMVCLLTVTTTLFAWPAIAGQSNGVALVQAVDTTGGTVTLLGESYRVTNATRMVDAAGRGLQIERLRPIPEGALLVSGDDVDAVSWQAVQTASGWTLTNLMVLKAMPE